MFQCGSYSFGVCPNYLPDKKKEETVVIVGPLRVIQSKENEKEVFEIIVGCNLSFGCKNLACHYSKASRDKRREMRLVGNR